MKSIFSNIGCDTVRRVKFGIDSVSNFTHTQSQGKS
jgi:hypothetical protein